MSMTILIVDDNEAIHELFQEYCTAQGYCAESARNGEEGLAKYCAIKPDIVLMDMRMPIMNGYEASKGIKSVDPDAKILLVTGHPEDPLATKSLAEGYVRTIIPKPFTLGMLFQEINRTLAA
ncbi:MAG: response regulator [Desulfobacterota bacterium]|nr:response regulator [Thermodesulfobacteriota bacterium]